MGPVPPSFQPGAGQLGLTGLVPAPETGHVPRDEAALGADALPTLGEDFAGFFLWLQSACQVCIRGGKLPMDLGNDYPKTLCILGNAAGRHFNHNPDYRIL